MQIILNHPHTHAGKPHPAGAELTVSRRDAEWLVSIGVANYKPGVHKRAGEHSSAARGANPAAGEPAAGARNAAQPSADNPGDTP